MPYSPASGCSSWPCPNRKPCPVHQPKPFANARSGKRYGSAWDKLSALVRQSPCVKCGARADAADHITPRMSGGHDVVSNTQPMCKRHHAQKTGREARARRG